MPSNTRPELMLDAQGRPIPSSIITQTERYDYTGTSPIYIGYARPGTAESTSAWQIRKVTYLSNAAISYTFPTNAASVITADYQFAWSQRASYTYA
jgi:hypothetical protein